MADNSKGLSFQSILEVSARATLLVVIMGLPAMISQYVTLNIPIALLGYRRVLEAGTIPAIMTGVLVVYFMWSTRKSREREWFHNIRGWLHGILRMQNKVNYGGFAAAYPAIPLLIPAILVILAGFISIYVWFIWALGWLIVKPIELLFLGSEVVDWEKTLIGIVTITVIIGLFWFRKRKLKHESTKAENNLSDKNPRTTSTGVLTPTPRIPRRTNDPLKFWADPATLPQAVFGSIFSYVIIPVSIIGMTHMIRITFPLVALNWPVGLTHKVVVLTGVFMGVAYAHFLSAFQFGKFTEDANENIRQGANIASGTSYGIFVSAIVVAYSIYIFPVLPRAFGGGLPHVVNITVRANEAPPSFSQLSKKAEANMVEIFEVDLIDKIGTDIIFCKKQNGSELCFVIPNNSITSLSWSVP